MIQKYQKYKNISKTKNISAYIGVAVKKFSTFCFIFAQYNN